MKRLLLLLFLFAFHFHFFSASYAGDPPSPFVPDESGGVKLQDQYDHVTVEGTVLIDGDGHQLINPGTDSYTTLAAITGMSDGDEVYVEGRSANADGGQGWFWYDSDIGGTADAGIIIDAAGDGDGRWVRKYSGAVETGWYGTDGTALQSAVTAAGGKRLIATDDITTSAKITIPSTGMQLEGSAEITYTGTDTLFSAATITSTNFDFTATPSQTEFTCSDYDYSDPIVTVTVDGSVLSHTEYTWVYDDPDIVVTFDDGCAGSEDIDITFQEITTAGLDSDAIVKVGKDVVLRTTQAAQGKAMVLGWPSNYENRQNKHFEFKGTILGQDSTKGFLCGIWLDEVNVAEINGLIGSVGSNDTSATQAESTSGNIGIKITGAYTAGDIQIGGLIDSWYKGLVPGEVTEGVHVTDATFLKCGYGIYWVTGWDSVINDTWSYDLFLSVYHSHMNTFIGSIYTARVSEANINGCSFYIHPNSTETSVDFISFDSSEWTIKNNNFVSYVDGLNANGILARNSNNGLFCGNSFSARDSDGTFTGIKMESGSRRTVAQSNTYVDIDTAVEIENGTTHCGVITQGDRFEDEPTIARYTLSDTDAWINEQADFFRLTTKPQIEMVNPFIQFYDTDGGVNEKYANLYWYEQGFLFRTMQDDGTTPIENLLFADTDNLQYKGNDIFHAGNVGSMTDTIVTTGNITANAVTASSSANTSIRMVDTGGATDEKNFRFLWDSDNIYFQTLTDALAADETLMRISDTGAYVNKDLTIGDNSDNDFSITFNSDTDDFVLNWDETNSEVELDAPNYRFGANADENIVIVLDADTNDATINYDEDNDELEISSSVTVGQGVSTEAVDLVIADGRTDSGASQIRLIGDTTYTTFGTRIQRSNSGANANSIITHRGTGNLELNVFDAGGISLKTSNTERVNIGSGGAVTFSKQVVLSNEVETCVSEAGTADPTVVITFIVSDGDSDTDEDTVSLADGTAVGQQKIFVYQTDTDTGDSVNVTPSNATFTDILFDTEGEGCTMVWDGTNWHIVSNNGGEIT
jgi:hypothetical protein